MNNVGFIRIIGKMRQRERMAGAVIVDWMIEAAFFGLRA